MKKLGLVGGIGPGSTVGYYNSVISGVTARTGKKELPPIAVESLDLFKMLALCGPGQEAEFVAYFNAAIDNLTKAGSDFIVIACNTPHKYIDELRAHATLPIISIVETACAEAKKLGYKKMGLLGTGFTMKNDFFQKIFAAEGITLVVPQEEEINFVAAKIIEELENDIINPETLKKLQQIIQRLHEEEGIEAVVLGCAELPKILNDSVSCVPCLDTTKAHLNAIIDAVLA